MAWLRPPGGRGVAGLEGCAQLLGGRDMGWVLARSPVMGDTLYQDLVKRARDHGINARQLVRIPQVPEQVGKPGFGEPKAP